jgi:hypothetical protein
MEWLITSKKENHNRIKNHKDKSWIKEANKLKTSFQWWVMNRLKREFRIQNVQII